MRRPPAGRQCRSLVLIHHSALVNVPVQATFTLLAEIRVQPLPVTRRRTQPDVVEPVDVVTLRLTVAVSVPALASRTQADES